MNLILPKSHRDEELMELHGQLLNDQAEWIDRMMKRYLSRSEYREIVHHCTDARAREILVKHGFYIEHIPDSGCMNLRKHGRIIEQFRTVYQTEDGQKIYPVPPSPDDPDPYGDSLYPESEKLG